MLYVFEKKVIYFIYKRSQIFEPFINLICMKIIRLSYRYVKDMKTNLEFYEQIRHLYVLDGMSQRVIARKLNISRNTVTK